jgi:hypothetical protein
MVTRCARELKLVEKKDRAFLEAECLRITKLQLDASDTERVTIRRRVPRSSGRTGPNWEPAEFHPSLPPVAEQEARDAISLVLGRKYALV